MILVEWAEVAHHRQEGEGIDLGNESVTGIVEDGDHEREGEGTLVKHFQNDNQLSYSSDVFLDRSV